MKEKKSSKFSNQRLKDLHRFEIVEFVYFTIYWMHVVLVLMFFLLPLRMNYRDLLKRDSTLEEH